MSGIPTPGSRRGPGATIREGGFRRRASGRRGELPQEFPRIAPDDPVGLCARCRFGRTVLTARATYWLCGRAASDPAFAKYPRLPVRSCPGYEPTEPEDVTEGS